MYKAALFDLDGTLTDSLNLSAQAFIHTFRKHLQREYTPEDIFAMFGPCEEGIFRQADASQAQAMLETFLEFTAAAIINMPQSIRGDSCPGNLETTHAPGDYHRQGQGACRDYFGGDWPGTVL